MPSFHVLCFDCAGAPGVVLSVACTVDKDRVSALSLHSLPVLLFATLYQICKLCISASF